jgi:hypothetical protein
MEIIPVISLVLMLAGWVLQIILAYAVMVDDPPRRVLVGKGVWALSTLVGGVFVAAVYFALHHGLPITNRQPAVIPTAQ